MRFGQQVRQRHAIGEGIHPRTHRGTRQDNPVLKPLQHFTGPDRITVSRFEASILSFFNIDHPALVVSETGHGNSLLVGFRFEPPGVIQQFGQVFPFLELKITGSLKTAGHLHPGLVGGHHNHILVPEHDVVATITIDEVFINVKHLENLVVAKDFDTPERAVFVGTAGKVKGIES
ncbi:MAG: hypothetical protein BWY72_00323 [Bacteroidetes bacterium ADurb.Bin416]|nr:MAG: hypothetical protein BWY72_00323 [Bacteroidetes bacterium ADurb.Bin416]